LTLSELSAIDGFPRVVGCREIYLSYGSVQS
jgi:hypothetical protein